MHVWAESEKKTTTKNTYVNLGPPQPEDLMPKYKSGMPNPRLVSIELRKTDSYVLAVARRWAKCAYIHP